MSENRIVDCRGLACPRPVVMTREALAEAVSEFTVIVDNETSRTNVARFAESQGARVDVDERAGEFHLRIEPGSGAPGQDAPGTGAPESGSHAAASGTEPAGAAAATGAAADAAPETTLAVYVSSAVMGHRAEFVVTVPHDG